MSNINVSMNVKGNGPGGNKLGTPMNKPQNLWSSILRLLGYMKKSSVLIVVTLVAAIGGTLMQVVSPKMLGSATTLIFSGFLAGTGVNMGALATTLLWVGVLYGGIFLTSFLQERLMTVVSLRTTQVLRDELKAKMNRLSISFFDQNSNGNLMSIASNDVDNVATNLQQSLTLAISSVILIVGTFAMMLSISPLLTLLACLMLPASVVIGKIFTPKAQGNNKKFVAGVGELNSQIEETYQGFTVLKSFQGEASAQYKFELANEKVCDSGWKARFFGGSMMHFMMLVQNTIYVVIAALGAMMVVAGNILIGNLQAFLQYSQQFSSPIMKLSQVWNSLLSAVASAERIFQLLDAPEMENDLEHALVEAAGGDAKVVFDNVRFGYSEELLMKGFNLQVKEGQMVAIVGQTGAGKTTLINLLERFYDIRDGSIRIDGTDIRSLPREQVRKRMAIVLQDTWLFSGTIYDNIRFGNEDATEEQIFAAARAAYADDFIQKLPQGYHTMLSEDAGNISQGQRQLITIARAFVANPEILILDEATSNVDSRTELVIQKAMRRLLSGRTSFVVAHRLSTIYDADNIVVMQSGDIVESGTHLDLLDKKGTYAEIYNSQFAAQVA